MTTDQPEIRLYVKGIDPDNPDRRMARAESWSLEGALAAAEECCRVYGLAQAEILGTMHGQPFKAIFTASSWEEIER